MNSIFWFLVIVNVLNINEFSCNNLKDEGKTITKTLLDTKNPLLTIALNQKNTRKKRNVVNIESNTDKEKVKISGLRLEPTNSESTDIGGFTSHGIPIVNPNVKIKIVVFGCNLHVIKSIGFTKGKNCTSSPLNVSKKNFHTIINRKLEAILAFPDKESIYKLCYCLSADQKSCNLVEDNDTNISTMLKQRKYILPLWLQIILIALFILLSGLFSGLNLGLMTLTPQELELICKAGNEQDRKYANIIIPVRQRGNFLLCSLLIGNVIINSAISILMDDLTTGWIALVASSAGIVLFGEIIPQSLCVKKGLAVGAKTIWITKFFMLLTFPIAYPLSKLLDLIIGVGAASYDRKKLMELIKMTAIDESAMEFRIAFGAMEITEKTVKDVMTKIEDVFMLQETMILNAQKVTEIVNMGYTRIPVYAKNDRNNVVSLLFIKDLALMDPDDNFTVKAVCDYNQHILRFVSENTPLKTMLEEFKKGDYHLAMVRKDKDIENKSKQGVLCGLVTLEDILEEILKAEIIDESDIIMDNVNKKRRKKKNDRYLSHFPPKEIKFKVTNKNIVKKT
uniref:CNNM transmembrane domain-containing protein n=1 Tax=Strongyloides venezuelensis TaxID=75913 RepID=A0A0K0FC38_STRVS